jgi:hypothetical protein
MKTHLTAVITEWEGKFHVSCSTPHQAMTATAPDKVSALESLSRQLRIELAGQKGHTGAEADKDKKSK